MSLFNFVRSSNGASTVDEVKTDKVLALHGIAPQEPVTRTTSPEVPEHVFVEASKNKPSKAAVEPPLARATNDIHTLYLYLEQNLEKRGYEDALINPDTSYMEENVLYINNDLQLLIARVKMYYTGYLRTIDFHIDSRSRSGMLETVDELVTHKKTVEEEMREVETIGKDADTGKGLCQNLVLGYKKGFRNGFAAITYNAVLGRKPNP
jgi:hypothetical protein